MSAVKKQRPRIGWREVVSLPQLGIEHIVAKIDTGAKTSALDAHNIEQVSIDGKPHVRFDVKISNTDAHQIRQCEAVLLEQREVTDSGGHREKRFVILTQLRIEQLDYSIEVTLTERTGMKYRMLIGRSAIRRRFVVDPAKSFYSKRKLPDGDGMDENRQDNEVAGIYLNETWTDSLPSFDEEE